jgi:hypothetical protein
VSTHCESRLQKVSISAASVLRPEQDCHFHLAPDPITARNAAHGIVLTCVGPPKPLGAIPVPRDLQRAVLVADFLEVQHRVEFSEKGGSLLGLPSRSYQALTFISLEPSGSRRTVKDDAVVAIDVDRHKAGCDDGDQ